MIHYQVGHALFVFEALRLMLAKPQQRGNRQGQKTGGRNA
jgi:hypothetical protein